MIRSFFTIEVFSDNVDKFPKGWLAGTVPHVVSWNSTPKVFCEFELDETLRYFQMHYPDVKLFAHALIPRGNG